MSDSLSPEAYHAIERAKRQSISILNPKLEDLPEWVVDERLQSQAPYIKQIVEAFRDVPVVVLDAPTGSGKTLIAETVRRMLGTRALYSCTTKALQEQVEADFMYASVVKGRANYPTLWVPEATADDCMATKEQPACMFCGVKSDCPYEIAKVAAIKNDLAIVNTSYMLTEGNGPGSLCKRPLMIVDEADTLESELMRWYSVEISERRARDLRIVPPKKVTVQSSWEEWFSETIPKVRKALDAVPDTQDLRTYRRRKSLSRLLGKLVEISKTLPSGGWVYTGRDGFISFKPVRVDRVAKESLWPLGSRWLLMSATTISPRLMLDDLGYTGEFASVIMPSGFSVKNRPVLVRPTADMSRKVNEKQVLAEKIGELCRFHESENILIHTVSYDLTWAIYDNLGEWCGAIPQGYVYTYRSSGEKESVVWQFRRTGGVLVAPSLDRGIDLPDDLCRVVIIAKVPFPYLGDRQVSARLHSPGGQSWYNVQTVRSIVQMSGRGVRHKNDWAKTYILDSQFQGLWNKARGLFPSWWVEALDWRV